LQGISDEKSFEKGVGRKLPYDVKVISVESDSENLVSPNKPGVVLFTSKSTVSLLFRAVSFAFRNSIEFIQVKDSDVDAVEEGSVNLLSKFSVKSIPALGLLRDGEFTQFTGDIKSFAAVAGWISEATGLASLSSYIETAGSSQTSSAGAESTPVEFMSPAEVNALFKEGSQNTDEVEAAYVVGVVATEGSGVIGWWDELIPKCVGAVRCVQMKCDQR
jgi:hypothetical protein